MSDSFAKDFAEIRELVAKRKAEILSEINNKKIVGKKQCQQWIEELCDLVIDYHPILSSATIASMQPTIKLVSIESTDDFKRFTTSVSSSKENESFGVESKGIPVLDISDTEDNPPKDGVKYKGVIRGLDSLQRDDDWNPTEPSKSPTKKSKSSRQTRSKSSKAKKSDEKSTTVESNEWSSEGKVLGGDTQSETQAVTHEDMRRLLAEKTEQRLAQMTTRGAKGAVKLPMNAPKDRGDTLIPVHNKPLLHWKV